MGTMASDVISRLRHRADPSIVETTGYRSYDLAVYAGIAVLGALQFIFYRHGDDIISGDVRGMDLAWSLLESATYGHGFDSVQYFPPGLPLILAGVCMAFGCTHAIFLRSMAIFSAVAFALTYELLRRVENRTAAAVITLLIMSSRSVFALTTQAFTGAEIAFFLATMVVLLAGLHVERG